MRRKFIHASSIIAYPRVFGQETQLDHIHEQMLHVDNHPRFRLTAIHRMRTRMQIGGRAMHLTYRREINLTASLSLQTSCSEKYSIRPIARELRRDSLSRNTRLILESESCIPIDGGHWNRRLAEISNTRVIRNECKMMRISPRHDNVLWNYSEWISIELFRFL